MRHDICLGSCVEFEFYSFVFYSDKRIPRIIALCLCFGFHAVNFDLANVKVIIWVWLISVIFNFIYLFLSIALFSKVIRFLAESALFTICWAGIGFVIFATFLTVKCFMKFFGFVCWLIWWYFTLFCLTMFIVERQVTNFEKFNGPEGYRAKLYTKLKLKVYIFKISRSS